MAPGDEETEAWALQLRQRIETRVAEGIKQGQALYSQGHLRQALSVWEQTADLDPGNQELQEHINRVERFLNKLTELHEGRS